MVSTGATKLAKLEREGLIWSGESSAPQSATPGTTPLNPKSLNPKSLNPKSLNTRALKNDFPWGVFKASTLHQWSLSLPASEIRSRFYHPITAVVLLLRHYQKFISQNKTHQLKPSGSFITWIGLNQNLYPNFAKDLGQHALYIDARSAEERLWASLLSLRSPAVAITIVNAKGFNFTASRRLQLAAEHGISLGFLFRPEQELLTPSSARSVWQVSPKPFPGTHKLSWSLSLCRARGVADSQTWHIEWSPEEDESNLHFHPPAFGRNDALKAKEAKRKRVA